MLEKLFKKNEKNGAAEIEAEQESTWQQRLIAERADLKNRYDALTKFLSHKETAYIDYVDLKLLEQQQAAMQKLLGVLNTRIERI